MKTVPFAGRLGDVRKRLVGGVTLVFSKTGERRVGSRLTIEYEQIGRIGYAPAKGRVLSVGEDAGLEEVIILDEPTAEATS